MFDINWVSVLLGIGIFVGGFTLGTMFGVEYQKVRVRRAWRRNQQRVDEARAAARRSVEEYHAAANDGAEDR